MKINSRKIFVISVLVICVIAINLAVFFGITRKDDNVDEEKINSMKEKLLLTLGIHSKNIYGDPLCSRYHIRY